MERRDFSIIPNNGHQVPATPVEQAPTTPPGFRDDVDAAAIWAIVRRRWQLMLATLITVLAIGAIYTLCRKPVYEASSLVVVVTNSPVSGRSDDVRVLDDIVALTKNDSVQSHIQLITSPEVIETVASRLGANRLKTAFGTDTIPKWAVDAELPERESSVIRVVARAYDRKTAADLANGIVMTYLEREQTFSGLATRQGRKYVFDEMKSVEKQLAAAQAQLSRYKSKTGLVYPEGQLQAMTSNIVSLQMQADTADVEVAAAKRREEALKSHLGVEGSQIEASKTIEFNPRYQAALARLDELHTLKAQRGQDYAPGSREMLKLNGQIASAEKQMKAVAETVVASQVQTRNPALTDYVAAVVARAASDAKAHSLKLVLNHRASQAGMLPEWERNIISLSQKVDVLTHSYQSLSEKYYVLLVNEKTALPNARQASAAFVPKTPAIPNKKLDALRIAFLGLVLAVGAAAVAERTDKRIRAETAVNRLLGRAPLAVIPEIRDSSVARLQIANPECDETFVEAFRTLRSVINYMTERTPTRLLAIVSPGRKEGKTTVSVNLAVAMAMDGKRVLLMDCDIRRPSIRQHMNLSQGAGFTSVVNGQVTLEEAVVPTNFGNLFCLPSGPYQPNPAEFLNSTASRKVLRSLAQTYDLVVLDCPPGAGLSDMQVLSRIVDGVLLVVSLDHTLQPSLFDMVRRLAQVDAPFVGHVFNRMDIEHSRYVCYRSSGDTLGEEPEVVDITAFDGRSHS